jgi:predicted nucleotidyltransferase component of viral defense system
MLQKQAVSKKLLGLVEQLQQIPVLNEFVLVGGTSLALQMGHRISEDIDLFTQNDIDQELVMETLKKEFGKSFSVSALSHNTINCVISDIKIDLLRHGYPYIDKVIAEDNLRLLGLPDIAAMKLNAIAGNGTRVKDFIDVYFLLDRFSLKQMFTFYKKKYTDQDIYHVRKSLTYFDDIPPDSWKTVRLIQEKGLDFDTMKKKLLKSVRQYDSLQQDNDRGR